MPSGDTWGERADCKSKYRPTVNRDLSESAAWTRGAVQNSISRANAAPANAVPVIGRTSRTMQSPYFYVTSAGGDRFSAR
jgi:hypothetical protein